MKTPGCCSEADKLRLEAIMSLNRLFKIPTGYSYGEVEKIVDCIIKAALLEILEILKGESRLR